MQLVKNNFSMLIEAILARMPGHAKFISSALETLSESEIAEAGDYIGHLLEHNDKEFLVDCYKTIVDDTLECQIEFLRSGQYRHATFAEVANSVYFDNDYMKRYMIGLALSTFFWPNHTMIRRFFSQTLPLSESGRYLEIGPGHGFFLLQAMRRCKYDKFVGVDISPASIALIDSIVKDVLPDRRKDLDLFEMDFLGKSGLDGHFDAIVMGEVLEHVEKPGAFLHRIAELAAPSAHIFITTCINAPAVDHIFLFRTAGEIEGLFSEAGLTIRDHIHVPHPGYNLKRCIALNLPINVAYVLSK